MSELLASPFFGIALSILAFWVGVRIQKKTGLVVCNPLLIGIVLVVGVLMTCIFGSIAAPLLIKLFRVKDPMTAGLAIGASSHAVGTSKALELGETEGAMSGLAIGVCGLITVVLSLFLM